VAAEQYTIMENFHPSVTAPTRDQAIQLAHEYMATHPATTMFVVKVVAVIETVHTQKTRLRGR
jgi:hypothetical protein